MAFLGTLGAFYRAYAPLVSTTLVYRPTCLETSKNSTLVLFSIYNMTWSVLRHFLNDCVVKIKFI